MAATSLTGKRRVRRSPVPYLLVAGILLLIGWRIHYLVNVAEVRSYASFVGAFFSSLQLGSLYALIALGFVIIYKATRVINFAIGEIMMFAAYLFLSFAGGMELPAWLALPLAVLGGMVLGGLVERLMIRPMLGESPITVVMVTIGLASILVGLAEIIWTADPQLLPEFLPR